MRCPKSLLVVVLSVVLCSVVLAATEYPLKLLVPNPPQELLNVKVATRGVVGNLTQVNNPEVSFKYQYTVERAGIQLRVLANRQPALGRLAKVTGTLRMTDDGPILEAANAFDLSDWRVWALGVLIIAAVVLIGMLVTGGKKRQPVESGEGKHTGPSGDNSDGPSSTMLCDHCNARIPADSVVCDKCGRRLDGGDGPRPEPDRGGDTLLVGSVPGARGAGDTMLIEAPAEQPIADLTVRESGSAAMRAGEQFRLRAGKGRIGRDQGVSIRLMDETVSREHATIWWSDGAFYIQDDASTAGTVVNGQKIAAATRLANGDEIVLGRTTLVFRML